MDSGAEDGSVAEGPDREQNAELVGGWARAFDLVASEYGWSDDQILDLTVARLRQIVQAITVRQASFDKRNRAYITWQTKELSSFIAAAGSSSAEQADALMGAVSKISMDPADEVEEAPKENLPGSYERAMSLFGPGGM